MNIREEINSCKHGKRDKLEQEGDFRVELKDELKNELKDELSNISSKNKTRLPRFLETHKLAGDFPKYQICAPGHRNLVSGRNTTRM